MWGRISTRSAVLLSAARPPKWRRAFGFTLSAHFSIAKFGEAGAAKLSKAWCDKLNFLFGLYREAGGTTGFSYSAEMLALYDELVDVKRWAAACLRQAQV